MLSPDSLSPGSGALAGGEMARPPGVLVLQAKRRIFILGLLLVMVSTLFLTVILILGQNNFPSFWAYMLTNLLILGLCGWALLAMQNLNNVRRVERLLALAALGYLFYWDVVALVGHYEPDANFLMTSVAMFLLSAALTCLIAPRKQLLHSLLALFAAHDLLTWASLLQFSWSRAHNAQLMSDILSFVTILCMSLLSTYQHLIAASHEEADMMKALAHTDPLTGLSNRRVLYTQLQSEQHFAILLLDLDDFKAVNDTRGHHTGDGVLLTAAQQLQASVGQRGTVGRWGGEEFLVLLPGHSPEQARGIAEQIRRRIEQATSSYLPVTASIGVTVRRPGENPDVTLKRADELLYAAKRNGKNQVQSG